jgi:hypothetical protein
VLPVHSANTGVSSSVRSRFSACQRDLELPNSSTLQSTPVLQVGWRGDPSRPPQLRPLLPRALPFVFALAGSTAIVMRMSPHYGVAECQCLFPCWIQEEGTVRLIARGSVLSWACQPITVLSSQLWHARPRRLESWAGAGIHLRRMIRAATLLAYTEGEIKSRINPLEGIVDRFSIVRIVS